MASKKLPKFNQAPHPGTPAGAEYLKSHLAGDWSPRGLQHEPDSDAPDYFGRPTEGHNRKTGG